MEKNRRKEILRSESLRSPAGRLGKRGTDTPQPGQEGRGSRGKDQSYGQHLACRARAHHGGGGRTPRRASSGRAARGPGPPPPCRSRRRGAPVPLFPLKAKAAEGPARRPPDRRPAAARLDTRLGEARQGGSARAPPTPARLEPARAPGRGPGGGLAAAALTQVRRLSPSSTLSRLSTLNMAGRGRRG